MSSDEKLPPRYTCPNCGSHNYKLHSERKMTPIYDGPFNRIGWDDQGASVEVTCTNCGWDLDPRLDDINRLFSQRRGIVFD